MDSGIAALIGVALGFIFSSAAAAVRHYVTGRRFASAVRAELAEAKELIHGKLRWLLRDEKGVTPDPRRDPSHQVVWQTKKPPKECLPRERLLYLGEPEDFVVNLPFWEQHILAIVELLPATSFAEFRREVGLVNKFVTKFRQMKNSFTAGLGDPEMMAKRCLEDLTTIHDQLMPEKAPVLCLLEREEAEPIAAAAGGRGPG